MVFLSSDLHPDKSEWRRPETKVPFERYPGIVRVPAAFALVLIAMVAATVFMVAGPAGAADTHTFTVVTVNDSGVGSLRQAMIDASAELPEDTKVIEFDIPAGPYEILLLSPLPVLHGGNTTIDGYTQDGASPGPIASRVILVAVNGQGSVGTGINIGSGGNTVQGLAIYGFTSNGIGISGPGATGNVVAGNYIGTYADGLGAPAPGASDNINISSSASGNTVGGSGPQDGNLISAAAHEGVCIRADGNHIAGNFIGTDKTGTAALGNASDGVWIDGGASSSSNNTIGGGGPGEGNLISGNPNGVTITGPNADGNVVAGNVIGLDATATAALPNDSSGVSITAGAGSASNPNTVGGEGAGTGNVIAANGDSGVYLSDAGTEYNEVLGNYIGTNRDGASGLGNANTGIRIENEAGHTVVGGSEEGRNHIKYNRHQGLILSGVSQCTVSLNTITGNGTGLPCYEASNSPRSLGGNDYDETIMGFPGCFFIGDPSAGEFAAVPSDGSLVQFADGVRSFNVGLVHAWNGSGDLYMTWYADAGVFPSKEVLLGFMDMVLPGFGYDNSEIQDGGFELAFQAASPGSDYLPVGSLPVAAGYSPPALDFGTKVYDSGVSLGGTDCVVSDNTIEGNLGSGVSFAPFSDSTGNQVTSNRIADNQAAGVVVWTPDSYSDRISGNSIYCNGGLGIDILGDGVTPNDGNNNNPEKPQRGYNFPVFSGGQAVVDDSGDALVRGTAPPGAAVELYLTGASPDPSGHGQGRDYLATVTAASSGEFSTTVSGMSAGDLISATAASPAGDPSGEGNTSEFSANLEVRNPAGYLAEGSSAWGFDTYLTIMNPNETATAAKLTYITPAGPVTRPDLELPASSQTVINPRDDIGAMDFSTVVESPEGRPLAVERRMIWTGEGAPSAEGHSSVGVDTPGKAWYLAEGSSAWGFECWLTILNPNDAPATCDVTYMFEDGAPRTVRHEVPAMSRASIDVAGDTGAADASIKVESDVPVVPERTMYGNNRREGHESIGTDTPSRDFYLAEGTTAWGFTTYLVVQNPQPTDTDVTVTYMTSEGGRWRSELQIPACSRRTVRVNDIQPVASTDLSMEVHGSAPIVAERVMLWGGDTPNGEAGHCSIGVGSTRGTFYLPDGETYNGHETWTIVQNPNNQDVEIEVSYMPLAGEGEEVVFSEVVPAHSRRSYDMSDRVPAGRAAVEVTCKTPGKGIVAEQAMYWNSRGAGTSTIGE